MSFGAAALSAAWLALVVLFCIVAFVLRQLHDVQVQLRLRTSGGNDIRTFGPQPGLELATIADAWPSELALDEHQILFFLQPTCLSCGALVDRLVHHPRRDQFTVLVPGRQRLADRSGLREIIDQQDLFDRLGVVVAPLLVQIDGGLVVQSGTAGNPAGLDRLINRFFSEVSAS